MHVLLRANSLKKIYSNKNDNNLLFKNSKFKRVKSTSHVNGAPGLQANPLILQKSLSFLSNAQLEQNRKQKIFELIRQPSESIARTDKPKVPAEQGNELKHLKPLSISQSASSLSGERVKSSIVGSLESLPPLAPHKTEALSNEQNLLATNDPAAAKNTLRPVLLKKRSEIKSTSSTK